MAIEEGLPKLQKVADPAGAMHPLERRNYLSDCMFRVNRLYHDAPPI